VPRHQEEYSGVFGKVPEFNRDKAKNF